VITRDERQIPLPEPVEREAADDFAPTRRLLRNFAALLAVGLLVFVVWYAYRQVAGPSGDGTVPVVKAEAGPIKQKVDPSAAGAGGIDVPFRDRKVYGLVDEGHEKSVKKSEALPAKRAPESGADGETEDDATDPAAGKNADIKDAKPADAKAADTKTAEAKKAEEQTQAATAPSGFRIQLAAVSSADDASRQWQRLMEKNKDLLGGLHLMVEKVEVPAKKQVLYRIQAGPFKSESEAKDLCAKLAARKVSCFFVKA
jgi:cell division septation protein DedD